MILAIETSTTEASLALLDKGGEEILWQAHFESDRLHNAKIFEPLSEGLDLCRGTLQHVVVGLGPGSYSGIRVGIAVAHGLGLALEVPVLGLESIAVLDDDNEFVVTGDARRSSYYLARIHHRRLAEDPDLMEQGDWLEKMRAIRESGLKLCTTDKNLEVPEEFQVERKCPQAVELAREVARMKPEETRERSGQVLQPVYLRAPYITQAK